MVCVESMDEKRRGGVVESYDSASNLRKSLNHLHPVYAHILHGRGCFAPRSVPLPNLFPNLSGAPLFVLSHVDQWRTFGWFTRFPPTAVEYFAGLNLAELGLGFEIT